MNMHLVLLSGGSGSRLWPLSNSVRSKQFLKVLRDAQGNPCSMVQNVFDRIESIAASSVTVVASATQESLLRSQLPAGKYSLVLEPERRDTAPAIMLACANLIYEQKSALDDVVVVMPIDSFADPSFYEMTRELADAVRSENEIVLLGVSPVSPSTRYGYILPKKGSQFGSVLEVDSFVEKPNALDAEKYMRNGALWNCGVFAFSLKYIERLLRDTYGFGDYASVVSGYGRLAKTSFDYECVEKCPNLAVIPYSGKWKDLGTWDSLTDEMADSTEGKALSVNTNNVHVINETGLPMLVSGLNDAVVVATYDGILVSSKQESSKIKNHVESIRSSRPMYERRHWGEYRVLDSQKLNGHDVLTKELIIMPGCQLSYQRHLRRSEVWTVASGKGEVVIDGELRQIAVGDVINILPKQWHALRAVDDLRIIEVQLGSPLVEEDIERQGFFWPKRDCD